MTELAILSWLLVPIFTLECPPGSDQVGTLNAIIPSCGLENCDARYTKESIEECEGYCNSRTDCNGYNWAPLGGDPNHSGYKVCTVHNGDVPTDTWGLNIIFCKPAPLECPSGSDQVGAANADIPGCGLQNCDERYDKASIEECESYCISRTDCKGYTWAPLGGDINHVAYKTCTVYNSDTPTSIWGNKLIFCKPKPITLPANTLEVTTESNHGNTGIMFDVVAKKDLTIAKIQFETQYCWQSVVPVQFELYKRKEFGTYADYATDSSQWEIVCQGSTDACNAETGECIVPISSGQRQALYLRAANSAVHTQHWGVSKDAVAAQNDDLEVYAGVPVDGLFSYVHSTTSATPTITIQYDDGLSAAKEETLKLDFVDGIITTTSKGELSSFVMYLIYTVIGLLLVNMLCFIVYCCSRGREANGGKYKVVSMQSTDYETDVQ